ncbi:MAG TPA: dihydrolipoamide acetyltransferase family protein, partial [Solirubrobacteraceae bacterium]|nr:dihydrolipoamide acetyltransferase family protein [Solirubrobacteraceae bacterium]
MATEIVMPRLSDSMEEGTVLQWFVAEGDEVAEGEPLVEVETDKASVTYESEVAGTVLSIGVPAGGSAAVGATIAVVGQAEESTAASSPPTGSAEPVAPASTAVSAAGDTRPATGRVKASPLARRIATELGIDLSTLAGSGPQGRVIRADVEREAAVVGSGSGAPAAAGNGVGAPAASSGRPGATRRPLTRMQQTIARRMAESRATIPDFELRAEVEMTALVTLREQLREAVDPAPSYNDFIVKAAAVALREFPRVNGSYREAELQEHARINVGIAVAAEDA